MDQAGFKAGLRRALPIVLPTFALGISFGVLAQPVLGPVISILMSALVFGGGAQFAALSVLQGGGTAVAAVIAGSLMNTRFMAMSLALTPSLRGRRWQRLAKSQAIVDASFVMADRRDGSFDMPVFFSATLLQYASWALGTAAGVLIGGALQNPEAFGLNAIFPAFYLALLVGELETPQRRVVAGLAATVTLVFMTFAPPGIPVIAGALAALWGLRGG
jgi:4-azaleucine resistance transporter AzlC